jgi:hypothetical protein
MEGVRMEIKYGQGLVFESGDGQQVDLSTPLTLEREDALRQIIRQGFRAPVGGVAQEMTLVIAGTSYAVFNLSSNGVGIYLHAPDQFEGKAQLHGMTLVLGGQSFTVDGVVMHLASDGANELCGIELTVMSPECRQAINDYLRTSRSTLFAT